MTENTTPNTTASGAADALRAAITRAFHLGQTYWQQADSESYAEQDKSDSTYKKYKALLEETCTTLAASAPVAPTKMPIPPSPADPLDVVYVEGWNAACEAFFGGKPPANALVITVAAPVAPAPQLAPMPYPTDAQIDAVYEQTMSQHLRSQDAPAVRRFGRAMFLYAWNAAAPKAAPPAPLQQGEYLPTGNPEADRVLGRLNSSDPDFDDCAEAAALIYKMVTEAKGPDGFATWKDAAIAARGAAQAAPDNRVPEAWTNLLAYALQDDMHNRLTPRVVDIAYTAFMQAKRPNDEDGGASDWFNDTKPKVAEMIAKLRKDLIEERAAAPAPVAEDAIALLSEVAHYFTGNDDLPNDLLPRIDALLDAQAAQPEGAKP